MSTPQVSVKVEKNIKHFLHNITALLLLLSSALHSFVTWLWNAIDNYCYVYYMYYLHHSKTSLERTSLPLLILNARHFLSFSHCQRDFSIPLWTNNRTVYTIFDLLFPTTKTTSVGLSSRQQFTNFKGLKNHTTWHGTKTRKTKAITVTKLSSWRGCVVCVVVQDKKIVDRLTPSESFDGGGSLRKRYCIRIIAIQAARVVKCRYAQPSVEGHKSRTAVEEKDTEAQRKSVI